MTLMVASAAARAASVASSSIAATTFCGAPCAAEGVGPFFLGGALEEHGRVARVGHGLDDVVALGEQAGVGGGRVEGEQDGAGLHLRDDAVGHDAQDGVRDGEDHDVGVLDGVLGGGDFTALGADAVLACRRVLAVEDGVGALLEVG